MLGWKIAFSEEVNSKTDYCFISEWESSKREKKPWNSNFRNQPDQCKTHILGKWREVKSINQSINQSINEEEGNVKPSTMPYLCAQSGTPETPFRAACLWSQDPVNTATVVKNYNKQKTQTKRYHSCTLTDIANPNTGRKYQGCGKAWVK